MNIKQLIIGNNFNNKEELTSMLGAAMDNNIVSFEVYNRYLFDEELKIQNISRDQIWLQLKLYAGVGHLYVRYSNPNLSIREQTDEAVHYQLREMHTSYADSYVFHGLSFNDEKYYKHSEHWNAMELMYQRGKVDYIIPQTTDINELKPLLMDIKIKPAFIQTYNIDRMDHELLRYCLENAIVPQMFGFSHFVAKNKNILSQVADKYNVNAFQVAVKFGIMVGIQPLIGTKSPAHIEEFGNMNFELSFEDFQEISKCMITPEEIISIYQDIKENKLIPLSSLYNNIVALEDEELIEFFPKIAHLVSKLDPTTLAKLIIEKGNVIIDNLLQNNANFNEINSRYYNLIAIKHGLTFIDQLKSKIDIPTEKLLLSAINDSSYFLSYFKQADLANIEHEDVLEIIEYYPNLIEVFIEQGKNIESVFVAAVIAQHHEYLTKIISKVDFPSLSSIELMNIIEYSDIEMIEILKEGGADFKKMISQNIVDILSSNNGTEKILRIFEEKLINPEILNCDVVDLALTTENTDIIELLSSTRPLDHSYPRKPDYEDLRCSIKKYVINQKIIAIEDIRLIEESTLHDAKECLGYHGCSMICLEDWKDWEHLDQDFVSCALNYYHTEL